MRKDTCVRPGVEPGSTAVLAIPVIRGRGTAAPLAGLSSLQAAAVTEPFQAINAKLPAQRAERSRSQVGGSHRPGATTGGVSADARVVVIIPAHNEQASIGISIESALAQTRPADRIIVVCDNCTDATAAVASRYPVEVTATSGNIHKKAGALNHALALLLPDLTERDFVLCMDADIQLELRLIERSLAQFDAWHALGAVSAHHIVRRPSSMIMRLQQMEMERSRRSTKRRYGRHTCMSGMASMFRAGALIRVQESYGYIFDPLNWTEDWQLTFTLHHLGWKTRRPDNLVLAYVPVTTWGALFRQRERWARGYFQTLCYWRLTRHTFRPWALQIWWVLTTAIWIMFAALEVDQHTFRPTPWLVIVTASMLASAVVTVRRAGARSMLTAGLVVPELAYWWWINIATIWGIMKHLLHLEGQWVDVREK